MELTTTIAVIDALGGTKIVAELTGRTFGAAWQWRRFDNFPPDTYLVLLHALRAKGHTAPDSLWRMVPPKR